MQNNNRLTIYLIIVIVILVAGMGLMYFFPRNSANNSGNQTPTAPLSLSDQGLSVEGLPVLGKADAPATILEFGDFQCSACTQFFGTAEPQIRKDLIDTGKANMVFKILTFIDDYAHKGGSGESWHAAQAAECANDQGKFWDMYDSIYNAELSEIKSGKSNENSGNLTRDFFVNSAKKIGMDVNQFSSCYDSQKYSNQINGFMSDAQKAMGQNISTPTLFVIKNGKAQQVTNPFDVKTLESMVTGN